MSDQTPETAAQLRDDMRDIIRIQREALEFVQRMIDEALPKFDWGNSPLDANAIGLLNEVPIAVHNALLKTARLRS